MAAELLQVRRASPLQSGERRLPFGLQLSYNRRQLAIEGRRSILSPQPSHYPRFAVWLL
jgi:hypothetical protein